MSRMERCEQGRQVAGRAGWMDQTNNIPKWIPVIHKKVRAGLKGYNSRSNNQKRK